MALSVIREDLHGGERCGGGNDGELIMAARTRHRAARARSGASACSTRLSARWRSRLRARSASALRRYGIIASSCAAA